MQKQRKGKQQMTENGTHVGVLEVLEHKEQPIGCQALPSAPILTPHPLQGGGRAAGER